MILIDESLNLLGMHVYPFLAFWTLAKFISFMYLLTDGKKVKKVKDDYTINLK